MKQAIFLTGGPGSGKDILIKNVFDYIDYTEYNIDQIKEKKFYTENLVVVGNSYNLEKILKTKSILESCYYNVSMIYVNVSEEISLQRLSNRLVNTDLVKEKLKVSEENLDVFGQIFNNFFIFENSFAPNSEEIREQIEWINKEAEELTEPPLEKFKKKIKRKNSEVSYDPLPSPKDGINQTFDTRSAGNGDLISNYQYESFDPNPLSQGIGFGSTYGNTSKQEPFTSPKVVIDVSQQSPTFRRVKNALFKKNKTNA